MMVCPVHGLWLILQELVVLDRIIARIRVSFKHICFVEY